MKTLSTEQQEDLQGLMENLKNLTVAPSNDVIINAITYWAIELKPKRVRKKVVDVAPEV